jgi:hypothetical protein
VSAVATAALLLLLLALGAAGPGQVRAQSGGAKSADAASSVVGSWHATMPTGLRVATLTIASRGFSIILSDKP